MSNFRRVKVKINWRKTEWNFEIHWIKEKKERSGEKSWIIGESYSDIERRWRSIVSSIDRNEKQ